MAGSTSVTIRVLSNRLPAIAAAARPAVVAEVSKAALEIQAQAQQKAPVLTGTLRRSIHSTFSNGGLSAKVGPSVEYGIYQEFGSRGRAARPFMRPAAEAVLPRFAAAVKAALGKL